MNYTPALERSRSPAAWHVSTSVLVFRYTFADTVPASKGRHYHIYNWTNSLEIVDKKGIFNNPFACASAVVPMWHIIYHWKGFQVTDDCTVARADQLLRRRRPQHQKPGMDERTGIVGNEMRMRYLSVVLVMAGKNTSLLSSIVPK
jgi:hypothetical protein